MTEQSFSSHVAFKVGYRLHLTHIRKQQGKKSLNKIYLIEYNLYLL